MAINQEPAAQPEGPLGQEPKFLRHSFFICVSLFLLAAAIRFIFLFQIPGFLEFNELQITLQLVNGQRFPLFNQHPHIGAFANYLIAAVLLIFGKHYWVPRFVIFLMGSLTVPLVYLLGKRLVGATAALLGALMLAGSMYHIFNLSHLPWSNSMTPFLISCCLLFFVVSLQEQKGVHLILSGFFFGLALQTHPSVITLVPALLVLFVMQNRQRLSKWIHSSSFYLTVLAALLGYGNMIVYNIMSGNGSVHEGLKYPVYSLELQPGLATYFHNADGAWILLFRLLSGAAESQQLLVLHWLNPFFTVCAFIFLSGILLCLWKKKWELPLFLATPMLLIPILNRSYEFCKFGRYLGFLIPIVCLITAYALMELLRWLRSQMPSFALGAFALWLILPAGYFFYHFKELKRTYSVLGYQDSSMKVFSQARKLLKSYDKNETFVFLDNFLWEASRLDVFLQTDGWNAQFLAETDKIHPREIDFDSVDLATKIQEQVQSIKSINPKGHIVVFVSPYILKPFVNGPNYDSLDGCLSLGRAGGNIYRILSRNIYYLFSIRSESNKGQASNGLDSLLSILRNVAPSLPDPMSYMRSIPRRSDELHALMVESGVKATLSNSCNSVDLSPPADKYDICQEDITTKSWDDTLNLRGRPEANKKRKKAIVSQ